MFQGQWEEAKRKKDRKQRTIRDDVLVQGSRESRRRRGPEPCWGCLALEAGVTPPLRRGEGQGGDLDAGDEVWQQKGEVVSS